MPQKVKKTKKLKGCWSTSSKFNRSSKKRIYGGNPPDNNNQPPATSNKYKCTVLLGKGTYGIVVGCNKAGETIAIKYLDISKINPSSNNAKRVSAIASFEREKTIHSRLNNINIVTYLSDITQKSIELAPELNVIASEFFALEHCEQGNLAAYLISMNGQHISRKPIISQIFAGLKYLYDSHIIHLDLKPQNILVTGEEAPTFKIADFGLAKDLTGIVKIPASQLKCGTMEYIPYFAQNTTFFRDIYAFYCIIYYITTCKHLNTGKVKVKTRNVNGPDVEMIDANIYDEGPFSWLHPLTSIFADAQQIHSIKQHPATYIGDVNNIEGVAPLGLPPRRIAKAVKRNSKVPVNYESYTMFYELFNEELLKKNEASTVNILVTPVKLMPAKPKGSPKNTIFNNAVKTLLDSEVPEDPDLAINPQLTPVKRADFPETLN